MYSLFPLLWRASLSFGFLLNHPEPSTAFIHLHISIHSFHLHFYPFSRREMSIIPSDSGSRPDPFAEFDRLSQQIMDRFFSQGPLSFPDQGFFSWASPFRATGFPFFADGGQAVDRWETPDSHFVRFRLPEGAQAGEAKAQVDEDGFVTVTVPKQELAPAPEKRRPNVRVVEIEEKN